MRAVLIGIEIVVAVVLIWTFFTQILLPAIFGTPLFPALRFRKQLAALDEVQALREAEALDAQVARERHRVELNHKDHKEEQKKWQSTTPSAAVPAGEPAESSSDSSPSDSEESR